LNVRPLFPTYLFEEENVFSDRYLSRLSDELIHLRGKEGRVISNVGGWQSENILSNPMMQILCDKIKESLQYRILPYLGVRPTTCIVHNLWGNINEATHWNRPHRHHGCHFSAVLFLTSGGGNLVLMNKNENILAQTPTAPRLKDRYVVTPKKGKLLFFPAGTYHMVEPSNENKRRISIAANCSVETSPAGILPLVTEEIYEI